MNYKSVALVVSLMSLSVNAQDKPGLGPSCPDLSVTGIENREAFLKYLGDLKTAAAAKDSKALARLVIFPLRVNASPKKKTLKNEADLKKHFSAAFTDKVLKAIAAQEAEQIFCRDQGAMIGNGEVWIQKDKDKIGIGAINP